MLTGKLEAIGFGFLIPVFFVSTGAGLDIDALFRSSRAILLVPVFLAALLVVRGLPACFTFGPWDVPTPSQLVSCKPRP